MKNKKLKVFITALLCLTTLVFSSCGTQEGTSNEKQEQESQDSAFVYEGTHIYTAPETNSFIVNGGVSDYKIVIPEDVDSQITLAYTELRDFFFDATGVTLPVLSEKDVDITHTESGKYISIGDTKLFESSGIQIDKQAIGTNGARVITKDNTIYIQGGDSYGCLYGVYDILEILFDFDVFADNCYTINHLSTVKLRNFDITDLPDIKMRAPEWKALENNINHLSDRLRMPTSFGSYFMPIGDTEHDGGTATIHNTMEIVPRSYWSESHPDWFSNNGDQLCYTCHGNAEELNALANHIALMVENSLMKYTPDLYPLMNTITVTVEDNETTMCNCEYCMQAKEKYGTDSASAIILCNKIMEYVSAWMKKDENKEYKRDNFHLVFFAYAKFVEAPAHYDSQLKKYVVNAPELEMRDDVGVFYAVSSGFNYQLDILDDANAQGVENSKKWFDIAPAMYLWTYDQNFSNYILRTNSSNFYNSTAYQFFAKGNAQLLYNQAGWNTSNLTSFQMLNEYLNAKLMWDSTLDINTLTDKWFRYMFKEAANEMKELYNEENAYVMTIYEKNGKLIDGIPNCNLSSDVHWSYQTLKSWLTHIDNAREKIEKYQTIAPEIYSMLKTNIDIEWICPAYFTLAYEDQYLTTEEYNSMLTYLRGISSLTSGMLLSERATSTVASWASSLSLK